MNKIVLILICCTFCFWSISSSQDLDKYQMMKDIITNPDSIKSICGNSKYVNKYLKKRLKNPEFIFNNEKYLKNKFSRYNFIKSDTIVVIKDKGEIKGLMQEVTYMNELGDIFCFQFFKKENEDWELLDFGDYEVWYPLTNCREPD